MGTANDSDRAFEAAAYLWSAHAARAHYRNLPADIRPRDVDEAYAAQDAFYARAEPVHGPVAGMKIATTTKVMQALMGIEHPCGGAIFARTIHHSPARLRCADFVNLRIECEIAVRLGADLPAGAEPYTAASVCEAVATAMPAFELIEDRHAVYKETDALSLIADNCWNAGVVLGAAAPLRKGPEPDRMRGALTINGRAIAEGGADHPMDALAWLANLAAERGRPLRRDMIAITGSLVATVSVAPGDTAVFTIDGLGETRLVLS